MAERWQDEAWARDMWWSGKTSRRRFLGLSAGAAGALGATMLVPAPWREAFGQAKPFKLGTLQPLSGTAASGGKTALVGVQMAVDRINKGGGISGRPIELLVADYESKPDVGRRKAEKLVVEDQIDAHAGGYLSNVCLACMPVYEDNKVVNMITVCLDTTITQSKCSRYTFRPFDFAPSQAVAAAPYMVGKIGKRWHIAYADYAWGQSTKDAYVAEVRKNGGEVVGTTGHPARHRRHDVLPQQDHRDVRRALRDLLRPPGHRLRHPELRPGPDQEVPPGRRRGHRGRHRAAGDREQGRGLRRHRPLHPGDGGRPEHAAPQAVLRRRGGAAEADRPERAAARPLRAVQLRGGQRAEDRDAEVGLPAAARTR